MKRLFVKKSLKHISPEKSASDISIETLPFNIENENGIVCSDRHTELITDLKQTITLQLEILRAALNSASVVLLWETAQGHQLKPYAWSSCYEIKEDAFSSGEGILGALNGRHEVSLPVYRQRSPAIPYSIVKREIGSFYATAMVVDEKRVGILCFEREQSGEWCGNDRHLIIQSISLLRSHIVQIKDYLYVDFERNALQEVFNGLRSLNLTLGLESVYHAAVKAIRCVISADLIAISSIGQDHHEFDFISTETAPALLKQRFKLENTIVGQVAKYGRSLPELSMSYKFAPVVDQPSLFDNYQSLLVVPLTLDDGPVSAVLIICAVKVDQFPRSCRERIEMIVAQVAIKIDLAKSHEKISAMSLTDPLTGISNRRAFQRALVSMHERAVRSGRCFSLILCDIDFFKKINDSYGHPFGDHVIQQIASQLSVIVRSGDLAARIGGEEFAVLVEGSNGKAASDIAERLRENVENLIFFSQKKRVEVTISIGVSSYPENADDKEQVVSYADQALYCAKNEGRNRVIRWNR
jgi:diguanylate cyclase (GGDEF)-like protein